MPRRSRGRRNPLAEVFGYPTDNPPEEAERYWRDRLCPFNNIVPNCTKDSATDPLGVCSVFHGGRAVVTCPVRFREDWLVTGDAAQFFFPPGTPWTSRTEISLPDAQGKSAGNIDVVLVSYDEHGTVTDFGALEVQAVYISGNVRNPFEHFMKDTTVPLDWSGHKSYPRPDYLSSSRKRLAPQLQFKGGILKAWGKRQAVAIQTSFYETLPALPRVDDPSQADIVWLLYDLTHDEVQNRFHLTLKDSIYCEFEPALLHITTPQPGPVEGFMRILQASLDSKLTAPSTPQALDITITDV